MKPILRSYLIEVNLGSTAPGAGQNINIQDYPQLRDVYITGIEAFNADQIAKSPAGKTVVAEYAIAMAFRDKTKGKLKKIILI